jgi:hypothetical protein
VEGGEWHTRRGTHPPGRTQLIVPQAHLLCVVVCTATVMQKIRSDVHQIASRQVAHRAQEHRHHAQSQS